MTFAFGQIRFQLSGDEKPARFLGFDDYRLSAASNDLPTDALLRFSELPSLRGAHFKEGWNIENSGGAPLIVYCRNGKPLFGLQYQSAQQSVTVLVKDGKIPSIRLGAQFGLLTALYRKCIGLHGVTLLCGDEIVILSAPSGTGKTTLAHLLETCCDAIVINGDFALLSPTADGVIFEPTPFCGTSGRCLDHRLRVNRVVFLSQAKTDVWRELTGREALARFMCNTFIPAWDEKMRLAVQENVMKCISSLKVDAFAFAPAKEAAETFFKHLNP